MSYSPGRHRDRESRRDEASRSYPDRKYESSRESPRRRSPARSPEKYSNRYSSPIARSRSSSRKPRRDSKHERGMARNGSSKDDSSMEVCNDFLRGRCRRSDVDCIRAHPPSYVTLKNGKVTCCFDYRRGRCSRTNPPCRFYHPPSKYSRQADIPGLPGLPVAGLPRYLTEALSMYASNLQRQFQGVIGGRGGAPPSRSGFNMPARDKIEVCREFKQHRCTRDECKYAHPPPGITEDSSCCVRVCMDHLNAKCTRESCRFFHPPGHLARRIKTQFNIADKRRPGDSDRKRSRRDEDDEGADRERSRRESPGGRRKDNEYETERGSYYQDYKRARNGSVERSRSPRRSRSGHRERSRSYERPRSGIKTEDRSRSDHRDVESSRTRDTRDQYREPPAQYRSEDNRN